MEDLRGFDRRRAPCALERLVERAVREFIGKAHAHAVEFGPHDDGVGDFAAIMDFAARARRHARSVDARAALRQVGDPAVDEVEDAVDGDVDRHRGAFVAARRGKAEIVHVRDIMLSW